MALSWAEGCEPDMDMDVGMDVDMAVGTDEAAVAGAGLAWHEQAACRGMDTSLFFPKRGQVVPQEVRDACARCPVRMECLEYALATHEQFGIWGGLSVRARRRFARRASLGRDSAWAGLG